MVAHRLVLLMGVLLAATVAAGCADGGVPTVYVSEPVPRCSPAAEGIPCDEFDGAAVAEAVGRIGSTKIDEAALEAATGLDWRSTRGGEPLFLDLAALHPDAPEEVAAYVLEAPRSDGPAAGVLSIASNAGMALWVDGRPVLRSRYARRALDRHTDIVAVGADAVPATVLYRVIRGGEEWRLYREWRDGEATADLLGHAIDLGAYAELPVQPLLADTATTVELKGPSVALQGTPTVRFAWTDLLGDPLEDAGSWVGTWPSSLRLPSSWSGAAVLRTEVTATAGGRVLYREDHPIFSEAAALALAEVLVAPPAGDDPVHVARVDAVRRLLGLDADSTPGSPGLQAYALAGLYRLVHDPEGYRTYAGPQVWGYGTDDGRVVPYWLTVPPGLETGVAEPRPLAFAVHHLTDPDYWRGRGAYPGPVIQQATLSGSVGGFGVVPHLDGSHDFGLIGARELAAITTQLARAFPVDTSRVGLLVWSQHARSALDIAMDRGVHLSHLTLAVPDVDPRGLDTALFGLQRARPGLQVDLWSGAEDTVIPPVLVESLASGFRERGFTVRHVVVPHSTHRGGLLDDVQAALRRSLVAAGDGSDAGRPSAPPPEP